MFQISFFYVKTKITKPAKEKRWMLMNRNAFVSKQTNGYYQDRNCKFIYYLNPVSQSMTLCGNSEDLKCVQWF